MPLEVLKRPTWHGEPKELGDLFVLRKKGRKAVCKLVSHQLGWECRLFIGQQEEIVQTAVCRTENEVLTTGQSWRAALGAKGWNDQ
jgi:hypothetical protein